MTEDHSLVLIHSDVETTHSQGSRSVDIRIYCSADSAWVLELVAGDGNSTVWEDPFETDDAAFGEAILAIKEEGIESFYQDSSLKTQH
jgi:uncharacterized protein